MISFSCLKCGQALSFPDEQAGSFINCGGCGAAWAVPGMVAEPEPAPRASRRETDDWSGVTERPTVATEARETTAQPRRKSRVGLVIALASAVVVVFVLGVGALGYWWFFSRTDLGAAAKYLPDDCYTIQSEQVEKTRSSDFYKRLKEEKKKRTKSSSDEEELINGIPESNVVRQVMAFGEKSYVTILVTKKDVTANYVKEKLSKGSVAWKEEKAGKHTIHYPDRGGFSFGMDTFCVPEDRIVMFGAKDTLAKILERDGKPKFSDKFKKMMDEADFGHSQTMVVAPQTEKSSKAPEPDADTKDLEGAVVQIDYGKDLSAKSVVYYKDSDAAKAAVKKIEENFDKKDGRSSDELLGFPMSREDVKISQSGKKITVTMSITADKVIERMKKDLDKDEIPGKP
jgi:hypothetical protein